MENSVDPKFRDEIHKLNEELFNLIIDNYKKFPYYDYSPTLEDYISEAAKIRSKYPASNGKPPEPTFAFGATATIPSFDNKLFSAPQQNNSFSALTSSTTSSTAPPTTTSASTNSNSSTANSAGFSFQIPSVQTITAPTPFTQPPQSSTPAPVFSFASATKTAPVPTFSSLNPSATPFSFTGTLFSSTQDTSSNVNEANKTAGASETTAQEGDELDEGEDAQPPQPNVDKFVETNVKFELRTKLYERNMSTPSGPMELKGCGSLYIKELENPKKLHLIVRQDPDYRRVLLNQVITDQIPTRLLTKGVQLVIPGPNKQTKLYIAKVKDDNSARQLYEVLNSIKA